MFIAISKQLTTLANCAIVLICCFGGNCAESSPVSSEFYFIHRKIIRPTNSFNGLLFDGCFAAVYSVKIKIFVHSVFMMFVCLLNYIFEIFCLVVIHSDRKILSLSQRNMGMRKKSCCHVLCGHLRHDQNLVKFRMSPISIAT